jgi:putative nucleotidyltransferase with HDIG domain
MMFQSTGQVTRSFQGERWGRRRKAAFLLRLVSFLIPIVAATSAGIAVGGVLPEPVTGVGVAAWWAAVIATMLVVMKVFDRLGRRLLPMVWLLRMTMAFPDEAPSRLQVMMRSGVIAELRERIETATADGEQDLAEVCRNILILAGELSDHDGTTRSHSERVQAYTDLLGEDLGLSEADRDRLRWAALLHDVGKLAVPAEILNKEGPPTEAEWAVIRSHPQEGMKIAAPLMPWLGPWAHTIEHHHEWYDGSGYPYGLAGEDIALGARIVAVADAYDTITSVRAYKKPLSADTARHELAASSGTHFDPKVVRALFNVSLGKLRWIIGPAAWLAQLPFLGGLDRLGRDAAVFLGTVLAFVALVLGGVAVVPGAVSGDSVGSIEAGAGDGGGGPSAAAEETPGGAPIDPGSAPPVAQPDVAKTLEDESITISVLDNDAGTGPEAENLSLAVTVAPGSGSTEVADGRLVYTPAPNFSGEVAFTYRVCRGPEACSEADVSVEIIPVNDAPSTVADSGETVGTNPLTVSILANDVDPDGDDLAVGAAVADSGSVVVNPDGTVTYTAPEGFGGADAVSYEACDPEGVCSPGALVVTVVEPEPVEPPPGSPPTVIQVVNLAPIAADTALAVAEDQALSWVPEVNDPDGDSLSCVVLSGPARGSAVVSLDCSTGMYSPDAHYAGFDEFTVIVSDGAAVATAIVSVIVSPVEDGPVATADMAGTMAGMGVHIDVAANDFDPDGDRLEISSVSAPSSGTAVVNTSGTVTYIPQPGFVGTDSFSYEVCDPGGACATGLVTVTVG